MSLAVACEVCDGRDPDAFIRGCVLHEGCAPKRWVKEERAHSEFMRRVRDLAKTRLPVWERREAARLKGLEGS